MESNCAMQLVEGRVGAQSVLAVRVAVYCRSKLSHHIHTPHASNTLPDPIDSADFDDTRTNKQVSHERVVLAPLLCCVYV